MMPAGSFSEIQLSCALGKRRENAPDVSLGCAFVQNKSGARLG
jgi:hypothetical protein